MTDVLQSNMTLAAAFDIAWARFLELEGKDSNTPENLGKLAARIVVLSKLGMTNERQLGEASLIYLRASSALNKIRRSRLESVTPFLSPEPAGGFPGAAFEPETVTAMGKALELCLDDLLVLLPQAALSVLIASILRQGAEGIKDPLRLSSCALAALGSRK